jgi:hypothetical protein
MAEVDVQAMLQKWREAVARSLEDMKIRQWCVEQAIKVVEVTGGEKYDPIQLAEEYLEFISTPLVTVLTGPAPDTGQPASPAGQTAASWPSDAPDLSTKLNQ